HPMLKETFKIGTQGGTQNWNAKLADENKRYTFFAPSDQAWVKFAKENPSEFKQLDTELYPPISRSVSAVSRLYPSETRHLNLSSLRFSTDTCPPRASSTIVTCCKR